ncbi:transketolase family protein [Candidatus Magnetomonas plexicatena]|uniref:transketolase family protein n=1 Tax=Candidatus Magnetomonas plexicatena TaxID=2552947 RepID=UPI001C76819B|nr:hypothetical protein E2O03_006150 [Nitrospirales bacterium LBB_01]
MRAQFKETLLRLALNDDRLVLLLGDVSVYMFYDFKEKYPDRFYNLGICENTIISVSAGLSAQGLIPFEHTINPFITERSYEQIKIDMCYNKFGGNILSWGASFDYAWDGPSHHSYTDVALLRLLPETEVVVPGSNKEVDILLQSLYDNGKTTYFRLSDHPHSIEDFPVEFGKGVLVKNAGATLTVITSGTILKNVMDACVGLNVNILYFHTIKPIDKELIERFRDTRMLVISDAFGLYEAVCEVPEIRASNYALPDKFFSCYGTYNEMTERLGLDAQSIRRAVEKKLL